jgi:hypothetical protein
VKKREGSLPYTTGLSSLPAGETNVVFGLTVRGPKSAMAERLRAHALRGARSTRSRGRGVRMCVGRVTGAERILAFLKRESR